MAATTRLITRPRIVGAALLGTAAAASIAYSLSTSPHRSDSGLTPPRPALSFPGSMLFSTSLTVTQSEQVNHDTKRITFALPSGTNTTGVPPGRAILTQHTPAGGWFPVLRPYTPIPEDSASNSETLQLLVKRYPGGKASNHMHSLEPGQTLTVRGPIPGYDWKTSPQPSNLLLVAGGAGITPIYSLLHGILHDQGDHTRVELLWGVNGTRDIVLKKELETLEKQFPQRLRVKYLVSGPEATPEAPSLGDEKKYRKGYINKGVLLEAIDRAKEGNWGDVKGTKVFVCGPPAMQEAVAGKKGLLGELGVEKKAIHLF